MDFDFLLAGKEIEYRGKKYIYIKRVNSELDMVAGVGVELPAPVLVVPTAEIRSIKKTGGRNMDKQEDAELREALKELGVYDNGSYSSIRDEDVDAVINFIKAHTNKAIKEVLDRLAIEVRASDYIGIAETIQFERNKLKESK